MVLICGIGCKNTFVIGAMLHILFSSHRTCTKTKRMVYQNVWIQGVIKVLKQLIKHKDREEDSTDLGYVWMSGITL